MSVTKSSTLHRPARQLDSLVIRRYRGDAERRLQKTYTWLRTQLQSLAVQRRHVVTLRYVFVD